MKRYRKLPVVIEATQIQTTDFTKDHPNDNHVPGVLYDPIGMFATIETLEGRMLAQPGDWIIRGIQGELYPCKNDIFHQTYEEVTDASS